MNQQDRTARIQREILALETLAKQSSIFSFRTLGNPIERMQFTFRGQGFAKGKQFDSSPEPLHVHEIDVRLPFAFPQSPPEIRWLTPIFHPNVSFSGFVNLADVGLSWDPSMGLDLVCERLWDVTRLADFNLEKAVSYAAKKWIAEQTSLSLPVDQRPLRDRGVVGNRNIVKYRRKGQPAPAPHEGEVLFIDDDTPAPPLPPGSPQAGVGPNSDDVLYIE